MNWEQGRQNGSYLKKKLLEFKVRNFGFDLYILKFPEGSLIREHVDPVDDAKHYRMNIILKNAKLGGHFMLDRRFKHGRINVFRPDVQAHRVTKIRLGTRYVLSFGMAIFSEK